MDQRTEAPFVPADATMKEFSLRAVLLGAVLALVPKSRGQTP